MILAVPFLVVAKLANITVPIVMKSIVDGLSPAHAVLAVPVALLAAYGALRLSSTLFNELRDIVFVKVAQRAMRRVSGQQKGRAAMTWLSSLSRARPEHSGRTWSTRSSMRLGKQKPDTKAW